MGNLYGPFGRNFPSHLLARLQDPSAHPSLRVDSTRLLTPTSTYAAALQILDLLRADAPGGLYHLTCSGSATWADFAAEICRQKEISPLYKTVTSQQLGLKAPRPRYHVLENRRLQSLGIDIMPPWKKALTQYLNDPLTQNGDRSPFWAPPNS